MFGSLLAVKVLKSARGCGEKQIGSQNVKSTPCSDTFRGWDVEKVHALVAQSMFSKSKNPKFGRSTLTLCGSRSGFCTLQKVIQTWGQATFSKRGLAWGLWRGYAKMHFAWQGQYERHLHQTCSEFKKQISWEALHFGASYVQALC